ncbi:MAG: putative transglutaminase-like cysteine proteinase [Alphaproteobacteria bacterium]|jgi:predicted transglutaminase-like cysteine proteinase
MPGGIGRILRSSTLVAASTILIAAAGIPEANAAPILVPGYTTKQAPLALQPQWQRLLSNSALQPDKAHLLWQDLHNAASDKEPLRQLDIVNRYFNRIRYGADSAIYGASDYWASPAEFIASDFGDCEDYSIAKYTALRAFGWSADSLFIVVVRDLKYALNHAVLATKLEGQWHILDNRASRVLALAEVPFYQPVYAVNENQLSVFQRAWPIHESSVSDKRERAATSNEG